MRVEIWADLICPWCGIGAHRLSQALERFGHADRVELAQRSFQLDPGAPIGVTEPVRAMLARKYGASPARIDAMTSRVEKLAAADGIEPYVVGENRVGRTALAHELAAWARHQGRGPEMWARLYRAYFGEARSIFDVEPLVELAGELGMDREAAREALTSRRHAGEVRADGEEARRLGAGGVPFVVVDRRYAVSGAQPVSVMLEALGSAWSERRGGETWPDTP
jgi:predicted DsbA family dithiol-disulfide isomerase